MKAEKWIVTFEYIKLQKKSYNTRGGGNFWDGEKKEIYLQFLTTVLKTSKAKSASSWEMHIGGLVRKMFQFVFKKNV